MPTTMPVKEQVFNKCGWTMFYRSLSEETSFGAGLWQSEPLWSHHWEVQSHSVRTQLEDLQLSCLPCTESGLIHWRLRQKHLQIMYHGHKVFLIVKPEGSWGCKCTPWYRIYLLKSNSTSMFHKGDTSSKVMSWRQRRDKLFGHDDIWMTCESETEVAQPIPKCLTDRKAQQNQKEVGETASNPSPEGWILKKAFSIHSTHPWPQHVSILYSQAFPKIHTHVGFPTEPPVHSICFLPYFFRLKNILFPPTRALPCLSI